MSGAFHSRNGEAKKARELTRAAKKQGRADARAIKKRKFQTGEKHPLWHWCSLVLGVGVLATIVAWFALGQYVDEFRLCTSTIKDSIETRQCSPVPPTAVAPGLIVAALFISPFFDEIDIAGIGRVKQKQKVLEQEVIDFRAATIAAEVSGVTPVGVSATTSPGKPVHPDQTTEQEAIRLWDTYLAPTRIVGGFAANESFTVRGTLYLAGNQDVDLTAQERAVLEALKQVEMVHLDPLSKWAFQKRGVLEMLEKQMEDLKSGKLSAARKLDALDATRRLSTEVLAIARSES